MKIKGELLITIDGPIFRTYTVDGNFIDYDIKCQDLSITIDDDSLKLVQIDEETGYIDYSDVVLGLK